ncbi:MFS transporter [Mycobacterium sp. 1165196.3]|uniref:MFS transporter n=1 Tax=Mycobacterium sp. 1165196.3 TaxID=1834071 RepID=UPI0009ECCE23|nr:MFS transporter [Mycobacterium sp. 1165196.3]
MTNSTRTALGSRQMRLAAVSSIISSSLEWYDFFLYGLASALVLGPAFFPSLGHMKGVLASFATFAVGFVARPLGSIVFGHFGDKFGRRRMVKIVLAGVSLSTAAIGFLPTYAEIGLTAPVLLVCLRVVQGLAVGGGFGGSLLLSAEHAPDKRRSLFSSFPQIAVPVGDLLANGVFLALTATLSSGDFQSWGWRIAFILGGILGIVGYRQVNRVAETPEFTTGRTQVELQRSPIAEAVRHDWRQILACTGANIAVNAVFYILVVAVVEYTTADLGVAKSAVLTAILISAFISIPSVVGFAMLADRIGIRRVAVGGALAMVVWAVPLMLIVETANIVAITIALGVGQVCVGAMMGTIGALFYNGFRAQYRYSGISLSFQLSGVLGGGLAPYLVTLLLDRTGTPLAVSGYIVGVALLALVSIPFVRGRKATPTGGAQPTTTESHSLGPILVECAARPGSDDIPA